MPEIQPLLTILQVGFRKVPLSAPIAHRLLLPGSREVRQKEPSIRSQENSLLVREALREPIFKYSGILQTAC